MNVRCIIAAGFYEMECGTVLAVKMRLMYMYQLLGKNHICARVGPAPVVRSPHSVYSGGSTGTTVAETALSGMRSK